MWHALLIPMTAGSLKQEDYSPGWLGQKRRSYLQNNQSKKGAGGVAQTVECLPSKHEALSSNPIPLKKKKISQNFGIHLK
jgi:hypothetical protein